jgi:hypothetical protein
MQGPHEQPEAPEPAQGAAGLPPRSKAIRESAADLDRFRNDEPIQARRPGLWTRLRLWMGRPERVRDAGIVVIIMGLLPIPALLFQGYFLLGFLSDFGSDRAPVRAGLLAGLAFAALAVVLRVWVGIKMTARRGWAIWTAFALQLLLMGCLVLQTGMSVRQLQALEELGAPGTDLGRQYVQLAEKLSYNLIPLLACCIALYAHSRNRDTLRATRSSPGARAGAVGSLLLLAAVGGWDALRGGEQLRPDVDHVGGTRLVYEADEESAHGAPYQVEEVVKAVRQRVRETGSTDTAIRPVDGRRIEVSVPRTRKNHQDGVDTIKEVLTFHGGLEFRVLANQHDDTWGIRVARAYFERAQDRDGPERQGLADAASAGRVPAWPGDPDNPVLGGPELASYSWVEIGPSEKITMGLDDASEGRYVDDSARPGQKKLVPVAEFGMDAETLFPLSQEENREAARERRRHMFWHEAAVARGEEKRVDEARDGKPWLKFVKTPPGEAGLGQTMDIPDMGGVLLYSRRVPEARRSPQGGRVEYFLLTRDPRKGKEVTGLYLERALRNQDDQGRLAVGFRLNQVGGERFYELTSENAPTEDGFHRYLAIMLDDKIVSAPALEAKIRREGIIHGDFTADEVDRYVNLLNVKPLPVRLKPTPVEETTVLPTLWKKLSWVLGPSG